MRLPVAIALLTVTLAGCAEEAKEKDDPLFGLCPQWQQGPGQQAVSVVLDAANPQADVTVAPVDGANETVSEFGNRSLDLYRIRFQEVAVTGGQMKLRTFAATTGDQKAVRDYRLEDAQLQPVVRIGSRDAGNEFDVVLSPIDHDAEPQPDRLVLSFTFEPAEAGGNGTADLKAVATFHYRVCGADV